MLAAIRNEDKMINLTFLIPDYHGLALLKKNLPSIISETIAGDQIIISHDGPLSAAEENAYQTFFQTLSKKLTTAKITFDFIIQKENLRFAQNVNQSVDLVRHDFFFLLNNDVQLKPHARQHLLDTITQNEKIFAVTAQEIDVKTKIKSGRNCLWWNKGRFFHARDDNLNTAGETAWACGGSSLYRTKIWRELAGFDQRYYPAYWEDIDLSFVAKKHGYQVLYQPQAVVLHAHQTTNDDVFGEHKIQTMSWRNGSRFAWKNSRGWQKLSFLFFYPWRSLQQFPAFKLWWLVLIFAFVSRFAFLGQVPVGLTVDEAAIAYNGYGIFNERRDEWLNRLPVSFRSFGDYKAPLAIYLNGFSTAIFGRTAFAVRLPFALASVFSLFFFMLLLDLLLREKTPRHQAYAAAAGLLLACTPWHFHYGRLGFENNFALLFILAGIYFLFAQIKTLRTRRGKLFSQCFFSWRLLLSGFSFALALYSYHSSKVFVPLFLLFMLIAYFRYFRQHWRLLILPLLVSACLLWPLLQDSFLGEGLTRANSSYLLQEKTVAEKIQLLGNGLITHFTPQFLLFGQLNQSGSDALPNVRHGDNRFGVLDWPIVFLIILACASWLRFPALRQQNRELYRLAFFWLVIGLIPAALTTQVPHSNQAFLAAPAFIIYALLGFLTWKNWWQKHPQFYSSFALVTIVLSLCSFLAYQHHYYQVFAASGADVSASASDALARQQTSYLFAHNLAEAFAYTSAREKDTYEILVAVNFEQPYIYALWARGTKPIAYQGGSLSAKYLFLDKINYGDLTGRENSLIIVTPDKISDPENFVNLTPVQTFYDLNQQPNLYLYETFN